nr:putative ribonuclease H-like domain-containing protein [Tanacetum cinerariifolium]
MRPFGCHVTILNTLDPLGKFDGKADEGFLVRYSVSSKAFKVFNSRTRIVQETLHINFLENQPNVTGSRRIQGNFDAGKVGKESVSTQQYVLLPLWSTASKDPQNTNVDAAFDDKKNESKVHVSPSSSYKPNKHDEKAKREAKGKSQIQLIILTVFNAAGPSNNAVSPNFEIGGKSSFVDPFQYPDDPDMPALEDIIYLDDEEDVENVFQRGKIDQTLFIKKQKGDILLVRVYVDDIIFGSTNKELCKAFEKLMKDKFQMSSMGELAFFLGLQVNPKDNGIFISQYKYVAKILRKFSLIVGKSASTPIDTEKPLLKDLD